MLGSRSRFTRRMAWIPLLVTGLALFGLWALVAPGRDWFLKRPDRPAITISSLRVEFGRLRPHQEVERVLTVENRGGQVLRMEEPTATCGCQKPRLARFVLNPGERTELILKQHARDEIGPFRHAIRIRSNDPEAPVTTVSLTGVVTRGVVIRPEPLVFEPLERNETRTRFLEVASDDGKPFRLNYVHAGSHLQVKAVLDKPGTLHRVEVTLRGAATCGPVHESITFNTDRADGLPLVIGVNGSVVGSVRVAPSVLMLGTVQGYREVTRLITLTGNGQLFQLEGIKAPSGGWRIRHRVTSTPSDGRVQVLEVTMRVPNTPGLIEGALRMETRVEGGRREVLNLPVAGTILHGQATEEHFADEQ